MQVKNSVVANSEQMAGFAEPGPDGPIYMVNLLKFKDKAVYADGRETTLSGAQAYRIYMQAVSELLKTFGGGAMFTAQVERLMLGEVEDLWDTVAIAVYPSRAAMLGMMQSDEMKVIGAHRHAGLEGQLNIECADAAGLWLVPESG
jgi:uncharacterized protein (DUF1330 family)